MQCVITDTNEVITEPKQILLEQENFYSKLYQKDPDVCFTTSLDEKYKLVTNDVEGMTGEITLQELTSAIKESGKNKTPGGMALQSNFI